MTLQDVATETIDFDETDRMWIETEARQAMKQAILHHDAMFRHQVFELHRLYWTQKNMMKEIPFDEINNYLDWSRKPGDLSEKATDDRILIMHHRHMNSTLGKNVDEWRQCSAHFEFHQDHQQTGFDLELPPDEYTNNASDKCFRGETCIQSNVFGSLAATELGLGSREDITNATHNHSSICTRDWINLNDSVDAVLNEEVTAGTSFIFRTSTAEIVHGVQPSAMSDMTSCDKTSKSYVGAQTTIPNGGQNKHSSAQSSSMSATKPPLSSCKTSLFDLNISQPEEESAALSEPQATYSSMSEGTSAANHGVAVHSHADAHKFVDFQRESSDSCSKELHIMHKNDTVHYGRLSKDMDNIWNCDYSNPESWVKLHRESNGCLSTGFAFTQQNSDGSSSRCPTKLSNTAYAFDLNVDASFDSTNCSCIASDAAVPKQGVDEKSHKNSQSVADISTLEHCKFQQKDTSVDINIRNVHGTAIQDLLHTPCLTDEPVITQLDSIVVDSYPVGCNPGSGIPDSVCVTEMCDNDQFETQEVLVQKQRQTGELDSVVLMAAEALCRFSLESPSCSLYDLVDKHHTEGIFEDKTEYSSDSFESIILSLPEVQVDEYTPSASLMEEVDKKDDSFRFKTRSGRRLRDFQKDILPGIVSLSRHEICEDMHAFTEIMRADSQGKRGAGKAFGGTSCTTSRNRRSKNCAVGRRR